MEDIEVRLRCIESASRNPQPHAQGYAAGVLEAAQQWAMWIKSGNTPMMPLDNGLVKALGNKPLGLPKKVC